MEKNLQTLENLTDLEKWHLSQIYYCREELRRLCEEKEPLTSEKMVNLANELTDHWLKSNIIEKNL